MSGARNRKAGHEWEALCARELREATGLDIVTGRALGANYGADLCTIQAYDGLGRAVLHRPEVLGFSVECKAVKKRTPGTWLNQARDQSAPGLTPVVLWKRPRKAAFVEGSAFMFDPTVKRGWSEEPISEWLDRLLKEADDDADVA